MDADPEGALEELVELHAEVDREAARLVDRHGERMACKLGCSACCIDGLTVFEVEAERIRQEFPEVLREEPGAAGGCAFLDEAGACRVYAARPYVCRTQGLPFVWFDEDPAEEGEVVEHRDICELSAEGEELEGVEFDELWLLGVVELKLGRLQDRFSGGGQGRVGLRGLFRSGG